jgi:hypothetical protein
MRTATRFHRKAQGRGTPRTLGIRSHPRIIRNPEGVPHRGLVRRLAAICATSSGLPGHLKRGDNPGCAGYRDPGLCCGTPSAYRPNCKLDDSSNVDLSEVVAPMDVRPPHPALRATFSPEGAKGARRTVVRRVPSLRRYASATTASICVGHRVDLRRRRPRAITARNFHRAGFPRCRKFPQLAPLRNTSCTSSCSSPTAAAGNGRGASRFAALSAACSSA